MWSLLSCKDKGALIREQITGTAEIMYSSAVTQSRHSVYLTCLMKSSGRCSWSSRHFSSSPTKKLTDKDCYYPLAPSFTPSFPADTWLTLCASHKSGGCSQTRFCLFLSCHLGRPSPRSSSWTPAVKVLITFEPKCTFPDVLCLNGRRPLHRMILQKHSPPPRCPGLWHSPSLSESARSEQTCVKKQLS